MGKKVRLWGDFESWSRADITKVSNYRYSRDVSTKPLLHAYAFNDEKIEQWNPAEGQKLPRILKDALRDPDVIKSAWNAPMEMTMWHYTVGIPVDVYQWRCSMVHALTLSFPGSLEKAGEIVNIPTDLAKHKNGKKLIRLFCMPQKPTKKNPFTHANMYTHPEEWEEFKSYNINDIEAEREFYRRTKKWDLPDDEWALWHLDQEINRMGIPINMQTVDNAIRLLEYYRNKKLARLRKVTGVTNPKSNPQMLGWFQDNGYKFNDMRKPHIEKAAADKTLPKRVREVANIRLEVSRTSPDKYYAMKRAVSKGRIVNGKQEMIVQGAFQFAGAQRTWRWSGRIFQPQNLPRPTPEFEDPEAITKAVEHLRLLEPQTLELIYDKPMDLLASCVRPVIQAMDGEMVVSADLNAIENRVLGWMAEDDKILDVYKHGRDPYIDFATYMYNQPYDVLWEEYKPSDGSKGDKKKRTIAKPGTLGCGYMLSAGEEKLNKKTDEIEATGLLGYAWNMGIKEFTHDDSKLSVSVWRQTFQKSVKFWWEIDKAARHTMLTGEESWAGPVGFDRSGPFLRMILPKGRYLHYCRPRIEESLHYWCQDQRKYLPQGLCTRIDRKKTKLRSNLTYEGLNDRNQWVRISTHPGKLTENADQAISRDCLGTAMKRFRRRIDPRLIGGTRLHIHDEPVVICKEDHAEKVKKVLIECLTEPMPWAPDLPLGAAGTISKIWYKD